MQFAVDPKTGRMLVIEMNPRVSRSSALASKATGFPIAKIAAKLAVGYTLDELDERHHAGHAGVVRADDRLRRRQVAALRVREVPGGDAGLGPQMKTVGEAMAIGRTFREALGKAIRSLETGRAGFDLPMASLGDDLASDRARDRDADAGSPVPGRPRLPARAHARARARADARSIRGSSHHVRAHRDRRARRSRRTARRARRPAALRRYKRLGLQRSPDRGARRQRPRTTCARARHAAGVRPVYERVDTCAAEFVAHTPYLYSTYEDESEARPTDEQQGDHPRRRPEPHRPGHRVRLLLRARRDGAARAGLRDDHGQLQPRDGVDRLRHVRPAVLRAAHARGRARDLSTTRSRGA